MPWLTPDEIPESTQCGTLLVPDNPAIIAAVIGALYDLTLPENWELFGAITPEQIASAMQIMFDGFFEDCPVASNLPVGSIIAYVGDVDNPPDGWYRCTGSILLRATYPELFAVIGTTYNGGGVPSDSFQLPDLRGRGLHGAGYEGGTGGYTFTMGERLGAKAKTIDVTQIPAHSHTQRGATASSGAIASAVTQNAAPSGVTTATTTSSVGGGLPFDVMQPVVVVGWLIRIQP